jgi:hypothetical protein
MPYLASPGLAAVACICTETGTELARKSAGIAALAGTGSAPARIDADGIMWSVRARDEFIS